jgi:SEC-C motif-containing protein
MRSRYSAFAVGAVDYLIDSLAPERRSPGEAKMLAAELRSTNWVKLEIVDTADGKEHDESGQVEFNAYFETSDGQKGCLHERSNFRRHDGKWVYVDGDVEIV